MSKGLTRFIAASLAVIALAACSKSSALTKAELIAQADTLCAQANADISALGLDSLGAPSEDNLAGYADALGKVIPIADQLIADVNALEPPEADEATITEMMDAVQDSVDALSEGKVAAESGDLAALNAAGQKSSDTDATANQLAADYGFKSCAE